MHTHLQGTIELSTLAEEASPVLWHTKSTTCSLWCNEELQAQQDNNAIAPAHILQMPQATVLTVLMQSNIKTGHPNDSKTKIARGDSANGD